MIIIYIEFIEFMIFLIFYIRLFKLNCIELNKRIFNDNE